MKIIDCEIKDVKLIQPNVFGDDRGCFYESFRQSEFENAGININFVQDNVSKSHKNIIRGLHYQIENAQDKLVACLMGTILDVAVDIRKGSPTFGKYVVAELSDKNKNLLLVPKGFAHGFSVLSEYAVVSYKCSDYYNPKGERGIKWDDKSLNINWRVEHPILNQRDLNLPYLSTIKEEDLF